MARTVKVNLVLDAIRYLRGARESARATKNVTDSVDGLGKAGDKASKSTDHLGGELSDLAGDARRLDRQIDDTTRGIRELAREIAHTSDAAQRAKLSEKLAGEQGKLRGQTSLRKLIDVESASEAGEEAARGFVARFGARLGPLMASAPVGPAGAIAGGLLGAAAAPTIAAAVSGAVVGGAGVGGVIGGVILAARDERVKAAGASLGTFILGDLEARSTGFVPPVLEGIADIRAGWQGMGPDLDRIFKSSRFVDPLVQGAISGGRKLVAGLADAVDKADPVVDALGRAFDQVGETAGEALSSMANDADMGADAIDDLTMSVTRFVDASAKIVHAGAVVKGWSNEVDIAIDKGRYWMEDWMSSGGVLEGFGIQLDLTADGFAAGTKEAEAYRAATTGVATAADFATLKTAGMSDAEIAAADASGTYRQKLDEANDSLGDTAARAATATVEVESLSEAIRRMAGENITAEQANIRLEEAIIRATEAGKANNAGITANTPKALANRQALIGIAEAANTSSAAIFAQTHSHELASVATERGRTKFLEAAAAMGVEKGEALRLANQLFAIPEKVDTKIMVRANTQPALDSARGIVARINNMHARIRVSAEPSGGYGGSAHTGDGYSTGQRWGGVTEYAQAGLLRDASIFNPVAAGARYGFAEPATGGEAFIPKNGDKDRSRGIWDYVGRNWLGMNTGAVSAGAAATRSSETVNPAHLAAAVKAALVGVAVQMDGRTVGYIQGRQADLLSR